MSPKEIQKELGIDANRIKKFKRDGIFSPENPPQGNKKTNYTEKDLENLRFIVVLTKAGITCGDIKKIQNGEVTLEDIIKHKKISIQEDIKRKSNAYELLTIFENDNVCQCSFNTDYYWNIISQKEASGARFADVTEEEMYGYYNISFLRSIACPFCGEENKVDLEDFVYDESSDNYENCMGEDRIFYFNSGECYECPNCGKIIEIEGYIREYPLGAYDSEEINIKGKED